MADRELEAYYSRDEERARLAFGVGRVEYARTVSHQRWGIEIAVDELDAFATVDLVCLSDDSRDWNEVCYPPLGSEVEGVVRGVAPSGELRVTLRLSDLDRAKIVS